MQSRFTPGEYVRRALAILSFDPGLYVRLVLFYSSPAALAVPLSLGAMPQSLGREIAVFALDFVTVSFAPVAAMVAVAASSYGVRPTLWRVTLFSLPWLPRYLWTNLHTSAMFWGPVLLFSTLYSWAVEQLTPPEAIEPLVRGGGWLALGILAVYLHTRTLLAPYLAVDGDLPGTVAALASWLLTARRFPIAVGTFLLSALPLAVPLGLLGLLVWWLAAPQPLLWNALGVAVPHLVWIAIQITRPLVISAAFLLYRDLWAEARAVQGDWPWLLPSPVRALVALTGWLPRLGRRPLDRENLMALRI